MKLMSLFDGSGGFPLAGSMCGITPVSCSEIEPYPIAVTCSRFPNMKHYGDVSKVNGAEVEPVDIITFGSPCQDMSVAGKRAGLKHTDNGDDETTRSGLFMEAVRIIKEMREKTNGKYPRWAIWENVTGAFSSNGGEDFHCVLEEIVKISEPQAEVPPMPKGGWPYADVIVGDGWSLAYRVLDAQYWGVPKRRRRIYLVADFASERAGEILFKRDSLRGYPSESGTERQGVAADAQGGAGGCNRIGTFQNTGVGWWNESDVAETLRTPCGGDATKANLVCEVLPFDTTQVTSPQNGNNPKFGDPCHPLAATGHPPTAVVYDCRGNGDGNVVPTLTGDHQNRVTDYSSVVCMATQQGGAEIGNDLCPTITASAGMSGNNQPVVCYGIGNGQSNQSITEEVAGSLNCMHDQQAVCYGIDCRNATLTGDKLATLQAHCTGGHSLNCTHPVVINRPPKYIVRRLTPTECARLQGFPDEWGIPDKLTDFTREQADFWQEVFDTHAEINGKEKRKYSIGRLLQKYNALHTDSAEYKMWGNGIALPCALYVMQGIKLECVEQEGELWKD